ncbi:Hypothetical predicted protein [Cloeon dipterum]|uniref:C3HC-type domain-containing protein n=1 Tax=Cloeon dipterum TaxID=197152 RepID=A0A8S1DYN3_9INSE|nr:Hypothetical predicted protein [Cloeon dipterum]
MHRLFTFPLVFHRLFQFELLHFLSDLGFYFSNECVNCKFCGFVITTGQLSEYFSHGLEHVRKVILKFHKNCKIDGNDSENVPMGKSLDDHLNYNYEAHRLYSLLKKNDWQYVTPFDLAKSGFYYSGREDNVICVFCNLEVRGWEEGDTPDVDIIWLIRDLFSWPRGRGSFISYQPQFHSSGRFAGSHVMYCVNLDSCAVQSADCKSDEVQNAGRTLPLATA